MNKFLRTKSHRGNKFSKTSLGLLCTRGIVVVHQYCSFSIRRQMTPQQSAKFITATFGHFCTSWRKDSVANYAWIWTLFTPSVRGPDYLYNALNFRSSSVGGATRFATLLQKIKKRKKIGRRLVPNTSYGYY